jgi:hypothetical protein
MSTIGKWSALALGAAAISRSKKPSAAGNSHHNREGDSRIPNEQKQTRSSPKWRRMLGWFRRRPDAMS